MQPSAKRSGDDGTSTALDLQVHVPAGVDPVHSAASPGRSKDARPAVLDARDRAVPQPASYQTVPLGPTSDPAPDLLLRIVPSSLAYRPVPGQEVISIGRQRSKPETGVVGNDFVVRVEGDDCSSMRISRQHLRIQRQDGCYFVVDPSRGGTLLNDQKLPRDRAIPLAIGDRLSLAGVLFLDVCPGAHAVDVAPRVTSLPDGTIVFEACRGDLVSFP